MGIKTKMVPVEYFLMEFVDLEKSRRAFISQYNATPNIHLVHPDSAEELREEFRLKVTGYTSECEGQMSYMGVRIVECCHTPKDKVETF